VAGSVTDFAQEIDCEDGFLNTKTARVTSKTTGHRLRTRYRRCTAKPSGRKCNAAEAHKRVWDTIRR
jgi:hypothetical protein